ncbi:MAG: VOC family protein [Fimbriimonadaceae bacterium]|nr:VOC family protein [Fimbriimonadaceae bacterium]
MALKLDLIGVVTEDMTASIRFYRMLGLEFEPGSEGEDHVESRLPNGMRFALDSLDMVRSFYPEYHGQTQGRTGLAFLCDSAEHVDELYRQIVDAGFKGQKEPWDAFWGQRYAHVEDPNGVGIDLFAWLPKDE